MPGHGQGRASRSRTTRARGPGVHQPGGRAAPLVLLLRSRALVPPGREDRPGLRHGLLGHGDGQREQRQAAPEGSSRRPGSATAKLSRREKLYLDALRPSTRRAATTRPASRTTSTAWRRSSRSSPTTSTPAPGSRWSPGRTATSAAAQAVDIVLDYGHAGRADAPGAHHYRIHLWDGVKPARAEKSAALYARRPRASPTPGTCPATPTPA